MLNRKRTLLIHIFALFFVRILLAETRSNSNFVRCAANKNILRGLNVSKCDHCECIVNETISSKINRKINVSIEESTFENNISDDTLDLFHTEDILLKKYFSLIPPFSAKDVSDVSTKCRKQSDIYRRDLKALKLWALKMYDSTAKIPSAVLNGNLLNQLGDFDGCLNIGQDHWLSKNTPMNIKGKYCLLNFQVSVTGNISNESKFIYDLIHSFHMIKSELHDPGHRVPRFTTISWGLCVPDGCTPDDVEAIIGEMLHQYTSGTSLNISVAVHSELCQMKRDSIEFNGTMIVGSLFLSVFVFVLYATFCDIKEDSNTNEIILCFSLKRTVNKLFSTDRVKNDIESVHGIRCLNAILLVICHKSMANAYYPYLNKTDFAKNLESEFATIGRSASLYTDPFIMFSGMLTYNSIINRLEKKVNVSIWEEYVSRLFRLIPTLGALILFCTWILPELGFGPMWPMVVDHHANICKQNWWRNFLFIHNYYGFEDMCLNHTHHIGIDTQLFALGVILSVWIGSKPEYARKKLLFILLLAMLSTFGRFYISYTLNLANYIYFGVTVKTMFATANNMYILPAYRFTLYAMGMFLAESLRHKPNFKLTQTQLNVGWVATCIFIYLSIFITAGMSKINYEYNPIHNAMFSAFCPIFWCLAFIWIIYITHHGYENFIGKLFSWRVFVVWTRLSYSIYLTQFPIFFYYVGKTRVTQNYDFIGSMFDVWELASIIFFSTVLTLIFELPFQGIRDLLFKKQKSKIN